MKISIITAAYHAQDTIKDAFQSVLSQTYGHIGLIEHIIVDGGSKDATVDIIKEYALQYSLRVSKNAYAADRNTNDAAGRNKNNADDSRKTQNTSAKNLPVSEQSAVHSNNVHSSTSCGCELKWISEPDRGIYDALNKGIAMATGDVIGILHTDDLFGHENVLADIAQVFENTACDGLYADMLYVDRYNLQEVKRTWIAGKGNPCFGWCPPHQTVYLKKEVYTALGGYRPDFTNVSDYDYMVRIFIKNKQLRIEYLNQVTVIMRLGGLSTRGMKSHIHAFREIQQSLKDQGVPFAFVVNALRFLRKARQLRS